MVSQRSMSRAARSEASSQRRNSGAGSGSIVSGRYADRQRKGPERQQPHEILLGRDDRARAGAARRPTDAVQVVRAIRMMIAEHQRRRTTCQPAARRSLRNRSGRQSRRARAPASAPRRRRRPASATATSPRARRSRTTAADRRGGHRATADRRAPATASAASKRVGRLAQAARRAASARPARDPRARRSPDRCRDRAAGAETRRRGRAPSRRSDARPAGQRDSDRPTTRIGTPGSWRASISGSSPARARSARMPSGVADDHDAVVRLACGA